MDEMPETLEVNGVKYSRVLSALRVAIHGMYDCHLFTHYEADSPEAIVKAWQEECAGRSHQYGPPDLCPAIVLSGKKELRRVGPMIHYDYTKRAPGKAGAWLAAVNTDPDIRRLLAAPKQPDS